MFGILTAITVWASRMRSGVDGLVRGESRLSLVEIDSRTLRADVAELGVTSEELSEHCSDLEVCSKTNARDIATLDLMKASSQELGRMADLVDRLMDRVDALEAELSDAQSEIDATREAVDMAATLAARASRAVDARAALSEDRF